MKEEEWEEAKLKEIFNIRSIITVAISCLIWGSILYYLGVYK